MTIHFTNGNRKIKELAALMGVSKNAVFSFDLPAGYTCPMADECMARANKVTGKITDGPNCQFRCYAASLESAFSSVRRAHWENLMALKNFNTNEMADILLNALPKTTKIVRIHASGDFFSKMYFDAWVRVAFMRPDIQFFGYTKVLDYVNASKPANFKLQYSFGGKMDSQYNGEPVAYVVKSIDEANSLGVRVACKADPADDFQFIMRGESFALLLHGTQPAKSKA